MSEHAKKKLSLLLQANKKSQVFNRASKIDTTPKYSTPMVYSPDHFYQQQQFHYKSYANLLPQNIQNNSFKLPKQDDTYQSRINRKRASLIKQHDIKKQNIKPYRRRSCYCIDCGTNNNKIVQLNVNGIDQIKQVPYTRFIKKRQEFFQSSLEFCKYYSNLAKTKRTIRSERVQHNKSCVLFVEPRIYKRRVQSMIYPKSDYFEKRFAAPPRRANTNRQSQVLKRQQTLFQNLKMTLSEKTPEILPKITSSPKHKSNYQQSPEVHKLKQNSFQLVPINKSSQVLKNLMFPKDISTKSLNSQLKISIRLLKGKTISQICKSEPTVMSPYILSKIQRRQLQI